jgi:multidrug efflux pump subunit AcrA (membrane-fusion protein)
MRTGPKATRKPPVRTAMLVQVSPIQLIDHGTTIAAMGTVLPAQEISLSARVGGEIVALSPEFAPGGYFRKGDAMLRIDPTDFQLLVSQRRSAVAQAESAYELEMGQQSVALREYELLGETVAEQDRNLVLRQPQLKSAGAAVGAAGAALEDALLDLERASVRAPFNAVLSRQLADVGAQVGSATPLGTLVGTDYFWVEVSVGVDQLRWLQIPETQAERGAAARIYCEAAWGPAVFRTGAVIRLRPGVEEQGRMARLLIAVQDPLALEADHAAWPRMILSTYVRVEIDGAMLNQVASIPRSALHDGDQVHLMNAHDELEIRPVQVVFRTTDAVFVRGVIAGERLITSDLSAPVGGMPLRLQGSTAPTQGQSMEARS